MGSYIVLKVLGFILLVAALLKGHELLTVPVAGKDLWSWRPFLILTVEFEFALSIWLLSGLLKKAAWLASLLCFSLFSTITLYKAVTGAASCGCFGSVRVNPWITLFAIDLPAVIALSIFRPKLSFPPVLSFRRKQESIKAVIHEFLAPIPHTGRLTLTACLVLGVLCVTTPILALNEPATITSFYEVLEPETWVSKKLPILEHIDIAETLKKGCWLVVLCHHNCPDCARAIPMYEQMARDLQGNKDFLRIALIEVPPYGQAAISEDSSCLLGKTNEWKERFVTTPAVLIIDNGMRNECTRALERPILLGVV
jgi:hypothetical protein